MKLAGAARRRKPWERALSPLPARAVVLDHTEPSRQLDRRTVRGAGERSRKRAKRRAVLAGHEQEVILARPLCLRREVQVRTVCAVDAREVGAEGDRRALIRVCADPHGALGAAWRVVDAADEVPCERVAGVGAPDTGAPPPLRVAWVIAGA